MHAAPGDIYQNGAGFQEIGGLSLATGAGAAFSEVFAPVDVTQGHGALGDWNTVIQNPNPYDDPSRPVGPFNQPFVAPTIVHTSAHAVINLRAAFGIAPPAPFRVTLYDALGGSSYWTPNFSGAQVGSFYSAWTTENGFTGNLDWSKVIQFSIASKRYTPVRIGSRRTRAGLERRGELRAQTTALRPVLMAWWC